MKNLRVKVNEKQIPLPRLRNRNDRSWDFYLHCWTEGPCRTRNDRWSGFSYCEGRTRFVVASGFGSILSESIAKTTAVC